MLLSLVGMLAFEGVAWVAAERFRQSVDAIDGPHVAARRQDYERISGWGVLDVGLRSRVNGPLRQRLVAIADAVIADYRAEAPTVGSSEWRQADDALRWALQLGPGDSALRAKQAECEAHVARIAAQAQPRGSAQRRQLFQVAIVEISACGRTRSRVVRSVPRDQPHRGLRVRRRRRGGGGDRRGGKARLPCEPPRAGAAWRRLPAPGREEPPARPHAVG